MKKAARRWVRVVFSHECDEDGNCPRCAVDYTECECPGPMQEDLYEYQWRPDGSLWARPLQAKESQT